MRVICDIGGTHIRLAQDHGGRDPVDPRRYAVSNFSDLYDAVEFYCTETDIHDPDSVAVAAAANDAGDGVYRFFNNEGWAIDPAALRKRGMALDGVINDFAASAWGMTCVPDHALYAIRGTQSDHHYPRAILGPGTGLGLAYALPLENGRWRVQGTHGGHMMAACLNDEHHLICELVGRLNGHDRMVIVEDVVSGRGLPTLYRAVCQMNGDEPLPLENAAHVLDYADNPSVVETLRLFHEFLGLFMHNVAITLESYGGLYLDGGLTARLHERGLFDSARVLDFMMLKPVPSVRSDLEKTPVFIVNDPYIALRGLIAMDRSNRKNG